MKIMDYKRAIRSPEVVRLLCGAISGKDPGELTSVRHSPDVPKPMALSFYTSQGGVIPCLVGVFGDLADVAVTAKTVCFAMAACIPEVERYSWEAANNIFFIQSSGMVDPPPIVQCRWLADNEGGRQLPLTGEELGKTYAILLDSTRPIENPSIQEALALLRGQHTNVTTELGCALQALLEAGNG